MVVAQNRPHLRRIHVIRLLAKPHGGKTSAYGIRAQRFVTPRADRAAQASIQAPLRQLFQSLIRHGISALRRVFFLLRPVGKTNLLFGALGFLGAAVATIRLKIVASVRSCKACTGFGIGRCSLCSGKGIVGWEGKWNHQEPCPSCLGRRYVECLSCGGRFHRPLFQHICTTSDTLVRDLENTTTTTTKKRGKMLGSWFCSICKMYGCISRCRQYFNDPLQWLCVKVLIQILSVCWSRRGQHVECGFCTMACDVYPNHWKTKVGMHTTTEWARSLLWKARYNLFTQKLAWDEDDERDSVSHIVWKVSRQCFRLYWFWIVEIPLWLYYYCNLAISVPFIPLVLLHFATGFYWYTWRQNEAECCFKYMQSRKLFLHNVCVTCTPDV